MCHRRSTSTWNRLDVPLLRVIQKWSITRHKLLAVLATFAAILRSVVNSFVDPVAPFRIGRLRQIDPRRDAHRPLEPAIERVTRRDRSTLAIIIARWQAPRVNAAKHQLSVPDVDLLG